MHRARHRLSTLFSTLICFVLVISPFYFQQNSGGEGLSLPANNWVWIFAIISICAAIFEMLNRQRIILPRYWLGITALPMGILISGFIVSSFNPTEWLMRLGFVIGGFLFFIALFQFKFTRRQIENILYLIIASSIIHSLYAFAQLQGWYWGPLFPITTGNFPVSIFQQVNVLASFLVTSFFISLFLATSPSFKSRRISLKVILYLSVFSTITLLIAIGSRSALVGFIVAFPLFMLSHIKWIKDHRITASTLLITLIVAVFAGAAISKGFSNYETKLDSQKKQARTYIYDLSIQLIKQKPLLGHGLGSFQEVFQNARVEYKDNKYLGIPRYSHPHNELLFWMIESGITSLLGILIATVATVMAMQKVGWRNAVRYFALLFPISFHTQVELPFYLSSMLWFFWLFLLFMLFRHKVALYKVTLSKAANGLITLSSMTLATFLIGFLLHSLVSVAGIYQFEYGKEKKFIFLNQAANNISFQFNAEHFIVSSLMLAEIYNDKKTDMTQQYINWSKLNIRKIPDPKIFHNLVLAYSYLEQPEAVKATLLRATKMYPVHPLITGLNKKYLAGDILKNYTASGRIANAQPGPGQGSE